MENHKKGKHKSCYNFTEKSIPSIKRFQNLFI